MASGKIVLRRGAFERLGREGSDLKGDSRVCGSRDGRWFGNSRKERGSEYTAVKRGPGLVLGGILASEYRVSGAADFDDGLPAAKRRKSSVILGDSFVSRKNNGSLDRGASIGFLTGVGEKNGMVLVVGDVSPGGMSPAVEADNNVEKEPGELEEEDFSRAPNILTSRWADADDLGDESLQKGDGIRGKDAGKRSSPESVLTQREGSEEARASTSGSDPGCLGQLHSGDECGENEIDDEDYMEVVEREDNDYSPDGKSELDSDDDDDDDMESGVPVCRGRDMLQGCRDVSEYERVGKISEGAYGVVFKARDKKTREIVALKKLKLVGAEREGFPVYFLREINCLMSFNHPSIVNVKEVVVDDSDVGFGNVFMAMEYMEYDLKALMEARKQHFSQSEVKCLMLQLLEGVKYLHDNWVIHRDLKTSNLLLNNSCEVKICDFGMARQYGSPLKPYTSLVVTLWYRAPELLLGAKEYSTAVDMWSVGCIMAELLANKPLFEGKDEVDQLDKIFRLLGTPNEKMWPGYSDLPGVKVNFVQQPYNMLHKLFPRASFTGSPVLSEMGLDLLSKLLMYNPEERISAEEALDHSWFREAPLPKSKEFMPTFPAHFAQRRDGSYEMNSNDFVASDERKLVINYQAPSSKLNILTKSQTVIHFSRKSESDADPKFFAYLPKSEGKVPILMYLNWELIYSPGFSRHFTLNTAVMKV
ncbi:Cyclin-dependent kinase G-2-like protein [Drosera capensis]